MKKLSLEEFNYLLERTSIKPRVKREVRFVASTAQIADDEWANLELLAIADRSGNKGVLVIGIDGNFYLTGYELSSGITSTTGRAQPIICDFCRTWQTGSRSGSILFSKDRSAKAIGFLCCADLQCSRHVRSLTSAARTSRSQLREDLTDEQRVQRLRARLQEIVDRIQLEPLQLEQA
jgi:hypothetical protein